MTVVLANGCFDPLHAGHVEHLVEARAMGDKLVVALTLDEHVNKGSGRPAYAWAQRAAVLMELRCVDEVIPSVCSASAIDEVKPDVFVKGRDYCMLTLPKADLQACMRVGAQIRFTTSQKMSSTEMLRKAVACASA